MLIEYNEAIRLDLIVDSEQFAPARLPQTVRLSREQTNNRRKRWTQKLTTRARASARSRVHPQAHKPRLVAEHAGRFGSPPELHPVRSDGRGVRLRQGVQEPRPQCRDQGPECLDDELAGVVAGRLRSLWRAVHPHGVAQRRHLPHYRRPRRRRRRPAALRAAQLLAGQCEPRQGAPAAVADQAEVRPQNLLGRPDGPRRQRRARIDGLQDLRFCRRPRRRMGA